MTLADGFDLCMLLIVLFFSVKGVLHGFTSEIFSLIGIIAGIYLGFLWADRVDVFIHRFFPQLTPTVSRIIAIAIIFFLVCIVCALVGRLLRALLAMAYLSTLDRMCGLFAGFVKGAAVVVFIVIMLNHASSLLHGVDLSGSRAVALVNTLLPDIQHYLNALLSSRSA
ncbi:MAG: CvpA family protein [Pyramidobacter sp.]|jgi:membrane protein required for colicin V production